MELKKKEKEGKKKPESHEDGNWADPIDLLGFGIRTKSLCD